MHSNNDIGFRKLRFLAGNAAFHQSFRPPSSKCQLPFGADFGYDFLNMDLFCLIVDDGWVVCRIFHKRGTDGGGMTANNGEQSSFWPIQGSFSTDDFINYDGLESLPPLTDPSPAPLVPQLDFKPEAIFPMPDMPANMWRPSSSLFHPDDADLVSYAQDPSYYYPTLPENFGFQQPMVGINVAGSYAAENSLNGITTNNNNLEVATNDQEFNEQQQLLPAPLGSEQDMSADMWEWDY